MEGFGCLLESFWRYVGNLFGYSFHKTAIIHGIHLCFNLMCHYIDTRNSPGGMHGTIPKTNVSVDVAVNATVTINVKFNAIRKILGLNYWSLSKYLKAQTKQALNFIGGISKIMKEGQIHGA